MAALVAGVQYGLSSQGNFNENKELIFVKLTDSAFRAIEEYLRNRGRNSSNGAHYNEGRKFGDFLQKQWLTMDIVSLDGLWKSKGNTYIPEVEEYGNTNILNISKQSPTIQFLGNEGHLSFPSSQSARGEAAFKFSLSSNAEDVQGSFECIQQTGSRCLESVGVLQCKMRIHANEDVYENTKLRMAVVEEEHKKNCTREIELDKAGLGRRVKVRSKPSAAIPPRVSINNGYHSSYPSSQPHPAAPAPAHTKPQGNNHAQKPGNPEIMRRSIRDRLIHLLAVRPYKKPELYSAVNRDGLRDRDKNHLMSTLSTIAAVRDNTYHLMRHVWNDVQEDWPFYTEQDRQMLKRRKPQNLTPPGSSDGGSSIGSGQSPSSVHPGSPPSAVEPPSSIKRPGYYNGADGFPTKRPRIARIPRNTEEVYRRSESPAPIKVPPASKPERYRNSFVPSPEKPPLVQRQDEPSKPFLSRPESDKPPPPLPSSRTSSPANMPSSFDKKKEETAAVVKPNIPNKTEYPKYLSDYTTILNVEQRRRYKDDFNANYNEYRNLHSIVEKVSRKFAQLEERLRREMKGSEGWKRIKNQILNDYEESKKDTQHQNAKRRFQYLHDKLSHIKRLVLEYDSNQHT